VERIEIEVDEERLTLNEEKRERLQKTQRFERTDRVPVMVNTNQWTALAARDRTAADYLRSPVDNLREQILNAKWRIEDVLDDTPVPDSLSIQPDLGCLRGVEFAMDITWLDDGPPKCDHPLTEPEQIDDLVVPDPAGGLNAKRIEWYHDMVATCNDIEVTLNGQPLSVEITLGQPGGPIPSAFALSGANMLLWMALEPERMHRLMAIVTESHVNGVRYFDKMMGRDPVHPLLLGCDTGEMLSPEMFRAFVVPYYLEIWEAYPGPRAYHNCGKSEHQLDIVRDDMGVTSHDGFGFCVDPEVLADKMAGRVVLKGGLDPSLVKSGTWQDIVGSAERYIDALGRRGGFILSLGGGAAPGTAVENYQALVEASRGIGCVQTN
jgi:uroporphyrinogen-III decarboxylase